MSLDALRQNGMMAHLIDSLQAKQDIGHYGRLVFAMVARHFLSESELIALLQENPGFTDQEARFPPEVYEHISGYYEGKAESSQSHS